MTRIARFILRRNWHQFAPSSHRLHNGLSEQTRLVWRQHRTMCTSRRGGKEGDGQGQNISEGDKRKRPLNDLEGLQELFTSLRPEQGKVTNTGPLGASSTSAPGGDRSLVVQGGDSSALSDRVVIHHDEYAITFEWDKIVIYAFMTALYSVLSLVFFDQCYYFFVGRSALQTAEQGKRVVLLNRWGTNGTQIDPEKVFEPESEEDVLDLISYAQKKFMYLRAVGASLSPNFVVSPSDSLVNLRKMNKVLAIDKKRGEVTVEAGATLGELLTALNAEGMTLRTIPSHRDATVGGVVSTGSHGCNLHVGPIDEEVVSLHLATSSRGLMSLSRTEKPAVFDLCRASFGEMGILTQLRIRCTKRYKVEERITVCSAEEVMRDHGKWIGSSDSLQYLWFPQTNKVVVKSFRRVSDGAKIRTFANEREALVPLRTLMGMTDADEDNPSLIELRNALHEYGPSSEPKWTQAVHNAEVEYWLRKQGVVQVGWVDDLLDVPDEGPQFTMDLCVPCLDDDGSGGRDVDFALKLKENAERLGYPIHAPMVQTWSRPSSSALSPAQDDDPEALFSWVSVKTFAPESVRLGRKRLAQFDEVRRSSRALCSEFDAIESLGTTQESLKTRKDVLQLFRTARNRVDQSRLFASRLVGKLIRFESAENYQRREVEQKKEEELNPRFSGPQTFGERKSEAGFIRRAL